MQTPSSPIQKEKVAWLYVRLMFSLIHSIICTIGMYIMLRIVVLHIDVILLDIDYQPVNPQIKRNHRVMYLILTLHHAGQYQIIVWVAGCLNMAKGILHVKIDCIGESMSSWNKSLLGEALASPSIWGQQWNLSPCLIDCMLTCLIWHSLNGWKPIKC